ncbi:hypothetical protein [Hyphomicrobium sp.]|uniref:hypothetical protein n=1 Tax=Hyphomicrobium sp. TaxID=82 RepID=UPI002C48941B|nr:hypothetical protein [Hyphomicrobium sp.]HVZ04096.1 hypothetical protein [Hyphomicrobium sp.]
MRLSVNRDEEHNGRSKSAFLLPYPRDLKLFSLTDHVLAHAVQRFLAEELVDRSTTREIAEKIDM